MTAGSALLSGALVLADRIEPQHLADHPLQFAIPVLVPTFVVVALVVAAVVRDRRRGDDATGVDDDVTRLTGAAEE